ncbi:hypothetical protein Y032_0083g1641 [Ancylostoma ceylanicum]|uniref:Uncharacterized protein n=1 Tax=Ancylostoma ceylanicum TaxID=53326 RepID=A0A016TRC6_9BILA|nr:hypothetical protein Y032_0083g1641 [Ancylostoma ceylanicum]
MTGISLSDNMLKHDLEHVHWSLQKSDSLASKTAIQLRRPPVPLTWLNSDGVDSAIHGVVVQVFVRDQTYLTDDLNGSIRVA